MIPKEVSPGPWACPAGDLKVRPIGLTFPYGSASLGPVISLQFLTGLHDIRFTVISSTILLAPP